MSQELERVYTINLGKVLLSPDNRRAKRAINMVREFARRHMKTQQIKIEEELSHQIWERGIRHPPRKIRVKMTKTDEGFVLVSTYEEEIETKTKPKKEAKQKPEPIKEEETLQEPKEEVVKEEAAQEKEETPEIKEKPKKETKIKEEPKPQKEKKTTEKPKKPAKDKKATKKSSKESKKSSKKE